MFTHNYSHNVVKFRPKRNEEPRPRRTEPNPPLARDNTTRPRYTQQSRPRNRTGSRYRTATARPITRYYDDARSNERISLGTSAAIPDNEAIMISEMVDSQDDIYIMPRTEEQEVPTEETVVGPPGPMGPMGPTGPTGMKGEDGRDGIDGKNGMKGKNGKNGRDGIDGPTGPKGEAGENGPTGPKGDVGEVGPAGPGNLGIASYVIAGTVVNNNIHDATHTVSIVNHESRSWTISVEGTGRVISAMVCPYGEHTGTFSIRDINNTHVTIHATSEDTDFTFLILAI